MATQATARRAGADDYGLFPLDIRRAGSKLTTKPFPWPNEAVLKQNYAHPCLPRRGIGNMQFILDLIWNHSRSRYLAALLEEKGS